MSGFTAAGDILQQDDRQNDFIPQYPLPLSSTNVSPQQPPQFGLDPQLPQFGSPQVRPPSNKSTGKVNKQSSETKQRLAKACDNCSSRKVKCDTEGPPCKPCRALGIPCKFLRPAKRRGPPNRHAEALKKQQFASPGMSAQSIPSSPTHAAHTLAAFAQHQVLSAETICPLPVLRLLLDDYFTYIHPLVPLPHEGSCRLALDKREDLNNPTFLAMLASMIGCLVASYPKRPRQHFRAVQMEHMFDTSVDLVSRCHKVATQAQGSGYLDQDMNVHHAVTSYLQGLMSAYTFNMQSCILYFNQCLAISTTIGLHKASNIARSLNGQAPPARMTLNGHSPYPPGVDMVLQELGRRTFWALFASVRSLQQHGVSQWNLNIPPENPLDPYPPLPLEIDDRYLTPTVILPRPPGVVSELSGFNTNVRIFTTYNDLASLELVRELDDIVGWELQKKKLEEALQAVKDVIEGLRLELVVNPHDPHPQIPDQRYPSPGPSGPSFVQDMAQFARIDFNEAPMGYNPVEERKLVQLGVQKANINANQLSTRLYLVSKSMNLYDVHVRSESSDEHGKTSVGVIAPLLDRYGQSTDHISATEQDIANQREDIVRTFLLLLGSMNQNTVNTYGTSFITNIRQIGTALLDAPRDRKGTLAVSAEEYLAAFMNVLMKLERIRPPGEGQMLMEDGEEMQLWAELRGYQAQFAESGALTLEL